MKLLKFVIVFLACTVYLSINLFSQAGGSAVPFLLITPDAANSGRGETGTGLADNIDAVFINPAGLAFLKSSPVKQDFQAPYFEGSWSYANWLPQFNNDILYFNTAQGMYVKAIDGFAALNYTFIDLGEFNKTGLNGQNIGKYKANEFSIGASYSTQVNSEIGIGVQLKYIHSNLSPTGLSSSAVYSSSSVAFDLGFLWKSKFNYKESIFLPTDFLSLGFNLQNIGPKITYENESDPLPTNLRLGAAIKLLKHKYHDLILTFDASKLLIRRDSVSSDPLPKSLISGWKTPGMELGLGIEYRIAKWFAVRNGYFTEPQNLGGREYLTFGASARVFFVKADISFIKTFEEEHPLNKTIRFTLSVGGENIRWGS